MWNVNPLVILEEENGEAILFNPSSLHTLWLNEMSLYIWKRITAQSSLETIIQNIASEFETTPENDIEADAHAFIKVLKDIQFIQ